MRTISQVKKAAPIRNRVQILRNNAGLGLREMAQYAGVSASTASRVESGKAPDIRTALRLARFFETTVEDLFSEYAP